MSNLVEWNKIEHQIDEARDLKTIIKMQEQVDIIKILVKQANGSLKAQNKCSRYRIFLEQKAGKLYDDIEDERGGDFQSLPDVTTETTKQSFIKKAGKSNKQINRWVKESEIPEEKVLEYEGQCNKEEKELTTAGLLRYIRIDKPKENIILPGGKYNVFLIDPPWTYRNIGVEGAVDEQYSTMTIKELCEMPIKELSYKNAVLFLWVTNPLLEESFEVIKSWNFNYKTNIAWIKKNKKTGIGFYVRGIHELLLICIKGQMLPEFTPLSIINEKAGRHSQKPEIYDLIEKMYPKCKYIEFFARNKEKKANWTYWGNEANI